MADKKGMGFTYDEHTEVPTFDEISSTMKPKKTSSPKPKVVKSKREIIKRKPKIAKKKAKSIKKAKSTKKNKSEKKMKISKKSKVVKKSPSNIKALSVSLVAVLVLLAVFGVGGFYTVKYSDVILSSVGSAFSGKITGNFAVQSDADVGKPKFSFVVKKKDINITNEESKLVLTMMSNCEAEKGAVVSDVRKSKDAECTKKIEPIEADLEVCEEDKDMYKDKYDACKDDLEVCEGGTE